MDFGNSGLRFFCLQKEIREHERNQVQANKKIRIFCDQLIDFSDTAALASAMDLVIKVDTSIAHLSCALGLKTWSLLPKVPDYRWMTEEKDSPWYTSAWIFRQKVHDDWTYVIKM